MYKRLFLFVGIALLAVLLWSLAGKENHTSFEDAHTLVQFRRIGHELLLSTGDTRSRVMPIEKVSGNEFRILFENPVAFTPDSLVAVVSRVINPVVQTNHYIVSLTDVERKEVIYSFGWPAKTTEIPCMGRPLPESRYALNILLSAEPVAANPTRSSAVPMIAAAMMALFLAYFAWQFIRRRPAPAPVPAPAVASDYIPIGSFQFYPAQQLLTLGQSSYELTSKETKLLRIFCESPNEVIDRNQLLKEGWEDEGVITGRSLDMYVSKLRKKLQHDPAVSIINVHGKGYRLNC